ncbi:hypothetical protein B7Y94_03465 [Candidatus Saccharibacteria bacterium 32-49-12]|nr:MAG: hypothetical protein B7Y94_03465 [Candidatus Saccharibacteria bacterium 32-49-12]
MTNVARDLVSRQTKSTTTVYNALVEIGHATNAQIQARVQVDYPDISATTIHRITARLKDRGLIGCAPKSLNGSERYDANPSAHHHFMCTVCGDVCDLPNGESTHQAVENLRQLSADCALAGTLTLKGVCRDCNYKEESNHENNNL